MSHSEIHVIPEDWPMESDLEKLNEYVGWLEPPVLWDEPAVTVEQAKLRLSYVIFPAREKPE